MLTQEQCAHFDVFGFLVLRQVFGTDEMEAIIHEFEAAMLEDRDGVPFDGMKRQQLSDWFLDRPTVQFMIDGDQIRGPIEQLLGTDYTFLDGNDGNFYVGDTLWHPDQGWAPQIPEGRDDPYLKAGNYRGHYERAIKVALYLDPVGSDTGCLRVIPGSHRSPYHEQLWSLHYTVPSASSGLPHVRPKMIEMWERDTGDLDGVEEFLTDPDVNHFGLGPGHVPGFALESQPGDAVFMDYQMWHASFGGWAGRRMFTLNYKAAQLNDDGGG